MSIQNVLDLWAKLQAAAERNSLSVKLVQGEHGEKIHILTPLNQIMRRPTTITGALHWFAGYEAGRAAALRQPYMASHEAEETGEA